LLTKLTNDIECDIIHCLWTSPARKGQREEIYDVAGDAAERWGDGQRSRDGAFENFGGYSLTGKQKGAWRGADGTRYDDVTERLEIVCDDMDVAREWVRWVGKKLEQKAMYFEVHASDVEILE
jgi:hypothetical protein